VRSIEPFDFFPFTIEREEVARMNGERICAESRSLVTRGVNFGWCARMNDTARAMWARWAMMWSTRRPVSGDSAPMERTWRRPAWM
jgi:hypothetical protein